MALQLFTVGGEMLNKNHSEKDTLVPKTRLVQPRTACSVVLGERTSRAEHSGAGRQHSTDPGRDRIQQIWF